MPIDGIINLLKPPKMTSNDAVVIARRILGVKKLGHTGTLDPAAVGVLPLMTGKATRLFDYLVDKDKEYVACIRFGISTDTLDSSGRITGISDPIVTERAFCGVLPDFIGELEQTPPMYSAVSVGGARLYQLARAGKTADVKSRKVRIYSLDYLHSPGANRFVFRVSCSKGTYIRTLCADIAKTLGVCAHMEYLVRTKSGMFAVNDSITVDELESLASDGNAGSAIVPCEDVLELPVVELSDKHRDRLLNGVTVEWDTEPQLFKLYCGGFIGVGQLENGWVSIKTRLI